LKKRQKKRNSSESSNSSDEEDLTPDKENCFFRKIHSENCELLKESEFKKKSGMHNAVMLNYWSKKALKYETEEEALKSQSSNKI
jgi:hypothetical protein